MAAWAFFSCCSKEGLLWLQCMGFSVPWLVLLQSMGSRGPPFSQLLTWAQWLWFPGSRGPAQQSCHTGIFPLRHVGPSWIGDGACVSCTDRCILYTEPPRKPISWILLLMGAARNWSLILGVFFVTGISEDNTITRTVDLNLCICRYLQIFPQVTICISIKPHNFRWMHLPLLYCHMNITTEYILLLTCIPWLWQWGTWPPQSAIHLLV